MNDTDVQATNTDCKPKLHNIYNLVLTIKGYYYYYYYYYFKSDWLITMLFKGQQRVDPGTCRTW